MPKRRRQAEKVARASHHDGPISTSRAQLRAPPQVSDRILRPQTRAQTRDQQRRQASAVSQIPVPDELPSKAIGRASTRRKPQSHYQLQPSQPLTHTASFEPQRQLEPTDSVQKRKRKYRGLVAAEDGGKAKKARLTQPNLQNLQRNTSTKIPEALDEWKEILQRAPTPPSEHIGAMENDGKSTKSGKSKMTSTDGGLTKNPFGFANDMDVSYGVLKYNFKPRGDSTMQQSFGLVATHIPSNYAEIEKAINKSRNDLPSLNSFRQYCIRYTDTTSAPDEGDMDRLFRSFIDPAHWDGYHDGHGRRALSIWPGMLPPPQRTIKPDMCIGIDPSSLDKHRWLAKHLEGHVRNRSFICTNGLVEYKTGEGSIPAARIQNQAAAALLSSAWLEDEQTLRRIEDLVEKAVISIGSTNDGAPGQRRISAEDAVIGNAFVGSICFDGNTIEASVHWLDKSISSGTREYDVFSMRVAIGQPFAVTLSEYQATYQKFANFLDWMLDARTARLKRVLQQPEVEPQAIAKPEPMVEASDSEDEDEGGDLPAAQSASNGQQPMQRKGSKKRSGMARALSNAKHSAAKKLKEKKR